MDEHRTIGMDATEGGPTRPAGAAPRRARKPTPPDDGAAGRARMEQALLDVRKARLHCNQCGALGNWKTDSVKGETRYLRCGHCNVGTQKVTVTEQDLDKAMGTGPKRT